ncbi:MAG: phosphatase PAP2 family protein [Prevotella sp.]|nr:phosphatase PAP2 family protein [Prevotella sp.]
MQNNYFSYVTMTVALLSCAQIATAQENVSFLDDESRPKGNWLPAPPSMTDGSFADDFYYYQWGVQKRSEEGVSEKALSDEAASLHDVFGEVLGIEINATNTPAIFTLTETAVYDGHKANTSVKNYYQRVRPFATFNQPSLKYWTDEKEETTFSYPSGHSSRGYIYAMTLCTVAPEFADKIMARAVEYALNRIICGHHWKSDTNAALLLVAGVFPAIVATEKFQQQLAQAREEYLRLKEEKPTNVKSLKATNRAAQVYDLQGRLVEGQPTQAGIYISEGKKIVNQ